MCKLSNLTYVENAIEYWTVDEFGDPELYIDRTEERELLKYRCDNDDQEFETWEEVEAHLAASRVAA